MNMDQSNEMAFCPACYVWTVFLVIGARFAIVKLSYNKELQDSEVHRPIFTTSDEWSHSKGMVMLS